MRALDRLRALAEAERERSTVPLSALSPAQRADVMRRRAVPPPKGKFDPSQPASVTPGDGWKAWGVDLHSKPGERYDEEPDPRGFVVKWGAAPAWPGQVVGLAVTGHKDMSRDHMLGWMLESVRVTSGGSFTKRVPPRVIQVARSSSFSYKELTSRGVFGPHLRAFGSADVVALFDEVAAFFETLEKQPVTALQLMKEMKGEIGLSGDVRWTVLGYLK